MVRSDDVALVAQADRVEPRRTSLFVHHGRHKLPAVRLILLTTALIPRLRPLLISVGFGVYFHSKPARGS